MPIQKVTKNEIIAKALNVFSNKGYHNTSMSDLAAEVGLLKGSFYHYFISKEELMLQILESIDYELKSSVYPLAQHKQYPASKRMKLFLKGLSKVIVHKNGGCILGNTILETANIYPSFRVLLTTIVDGIIQSFTAIYQELHTQEQAHILAQQTLMELEGAIMFSKLYSNPSIFQDFQKRMIQRVETDS